jgi:Phage terminase, small subunit
MEGPGRKSGASLAIAPVAPWARLEPPETLTDTQVALWRAIVATKPSDWFNADSSPVLEAYCQAVDSYRRTAAALAQISPSADPKPYIDMAKLADQQQKTIKSLATALRLTPQARYTPQAAATANKKAASTAKPWER